MAKQFENQPKCFKTGDDARLQHQLHMRDANISVGTQRRGQIF